MPKENETAQQALDGCAQKLGSRAKGYNFMKKLLLLMALLAAAASHSATAGESHGNEKLTIAVFGDWPYNQNLLNNAGLLTGSINSDPDVSLVIHVGDIHSGSMPCTSAGILPPLTASNPGWNQAVYFQFQQFKRPVVYTPGDNEWSDCHKTKELASGSPLKELASVRSLFFARPGKTLGLEDKDVLSQAKYFDSAYPSDAEYVENVMWEDGKTVFAIVNMPGSNNDTLPWTNGYENEALHAQEVANRTAAAIRWLKAAFGLAESRNSRAVVIALQADMWDPEALAPGGDGLSAYTPFVQQLAALSLRFGKPVLLLNGDSHKFGSDRPLADPNSSTGVIHHTPAVPNLTRITVQGSTNKPAEWLRLVIDTRTPGVFSWQNVVFCKDPLGSCL
ncbi:MAG TPA: metallophosphoesterase, partial [Methylocella sp.]|nr:metallophosphoesterase [Methylocella sp.]